uniref:Uncharacterized protein n=1 Tax=Ackermannviridae sp. TaxID=2831612 RepID=A0A8S5VIL1_9CAUD|nr:MAG TPA: hypothetical protein [Ackermannviridae sp.]
MQNSKIKQNVRASIDAKQNVWYSVVIPNKTRKISEFQRNELCVLWFV